MPVRDHTAELEEAIGAALARSGVAGQVAVRGTAVELHGAGRVASVDLGDLSRQWPLLPPDIRARKVNEAARRLRAAAQGRKPGAGWGAGLLAGRLRPLMAIAVATVLVVAAVRWLHRSNFFGPASADHGETGGPSRAPVTETTATAELAARHRDVCESARRRLLAGGTMAGFDSAGWELVLWLGRRAGAPSWATTVAEQARAGSWASEARETLGGSEEATLRVVDAERSRAARLAPGSLSLRLGGAFVRAFFEPEGRSRLIELVGRWAARQGADYAALYGTCAHRDDADMGAWYAGRDRQGAIVALLLAGGLCSSSPPVGVDELPGQGDLLRRLDAWARDLDEGRVTAVLAATGGTMSLVASRASADAAAPNLAARLRFPLGGPTRALAASRQLLEGAASETPP